MNLSLFTIDDFFPDYKEARELALSHDFTQAPEYDGHRYPGFAPITDLNFINYVAELLRSSINAGAVSIKMAAFVSAQEGFSTQQWIHSDNCCAKFAAVCHLHDRRGQGTQFWSHKVYGDALTQKLENFADIMELRIAGQADGHGTDLSDIWWDKTDYADSKPNRLYLYPTSRFHSRWPQHGTGSTPEDSRLTMVLFFDVQ